MFTNVEIATAFEEMADLLELSGENAFRIRAYRNGAKAIRDLTESVAELIHAGTDLTTIDGIGSTLAEKSAVLVKTGNLPQLDKLRKEVPPTLRDIMQVPGVGAKKAMKMFQELQVFDLASLRAACEAGLVASLKGFGVKTQQSILQNMQIAEKAAQRLTIDQADFLVERLQTHMKNCTAVQRLDFAGSYRRGKETIGDLDILVISDDNASVMNHFASFASIQETIARGETKMSVRVIDSFQVDLRVVAKKSWGAALQYFTGSKEHNVHLRGLAKAKGMKINEYGVFDANDETKVLAGADEESIYALVGMPWVPPELREDRGEFETAMQRRFQSLIQLPNIRGDLHMHTVATDGENTIEEMVAAAKARGLEYIAITDHSKRVSMARGLDETRLLKQWEEIDAINGSSDGKFLILKGVECDILEDGRMDIADACLEQADWVTASIHYGQRQPREQITQRILGALENPHVHAISHPTGRLISRRDPYDVDLSAVIESAKSHGKYLELNANPSRLDLNDINTAAAVAAGVTIVINTDAHSVSNLDLMKYGITQARRAGVVPENVLNTLSLADLKRILLMCMLVVFIGCGEAKQAKMKTSPTTVETLQGPIDLENLMAHEPMLIKRLNNGRIVLQQDPHIQWNDIIIDRTPVDNEAWKQLQSGADNWRLERKREAISDWETVTSDYLGSKPAFAALVNTAQCRHALGQSDEAIHAYKTALSLDLQECDDYKNHICIMLSHAYVERQDLENAIRYARLAQTTYRGFIFCSICKAMEDSRIDRYIRQLQRADAEQRTVRLESPEEWSAAWDADQDRSAAR